MNKGRLLGLAALMLLVAGCKSDEGDKPIDASCESSSECPSSIQPICDTVIGVCSTCDTGAECLAKSPDAPICAPNGACVECLAHSDCDSGICDVAGNTCVAAGEIAYAAPGNDSNTTCAQNVPCSLPNALALTSRPYVLVQAGAYSLSGTLTVGRSVSIVGEGGVIWSRGESTVPMVQVSAADVTIENVTIGSVGGPNGGADSSSIKVTSTGALTLQGCKVHMNANPAAPAILSQGALTVIGSEIYGNNGGAIKVEGPFFIVNNFIVGNGSQTSNIGGIEIQNGGVAGKVYFLAYNTIAYNFANYLSGANAYGIECSGKATMVNNIVDKNPSNAADGTGQIKFEAECALDHTAGNGRPPNGAKVTNGISESVIFVNADGNDFRLNATSGARGRGLAISEVTTDYFGKKRATGTAPDGPTPGAHEPQ